MKGTILDKQVDINVITVILSHNNNDNINIFHCPYCGNKMIQFKGDIAQILPGEVPMKLSTILRCSNNKCRRNYCFRDIVG